MVNSHYGLIRRRGACHPADCVFNQILPAAEQTGAKMRKEQRTKQNKLSKQEQFTFFVLYYFAAHWRQLRRTGYFFLTIISNEYFVGKETNTQENRASD